MTYLASFREINAFEKLMPPPWRHPLNAEYVCIYDVLSEIWRRVLSDALSLRRRRGRKR
jgi:hypothetical protein